MGSRSDRIRSFAWGNGAVSGTGRRNLAKSPDFPKYDRGCYEEGNSTMLLSGGLGNHTLKIRVNNIPEIMVVELKRKG